MIRWTLLRASEAVGLTVLGTVVLVTLVHLLPGDPLGAIFGEQAIDPATAAALRAHWQLDRPLPVTIVQFLGNAMHGDFGISIAEARPVSALILERLGPTLLLGGLTLAVHFSLGLAVGLWSALHPRHPVGRIVGGLALAAYAVPAFVIGLVLVWLLAVAYPIFPPAGFTDPLMSPNAPGMAKALDIGKHLVLPLATMVLATIAVPIRLQRTAALETATAPWVTAARARGVPECQVALRHIWRPALTPIVTLLGLWLPLLVSGAVFVEAVFAWPGLGSLIATATATRDFPVVIGAGALLIAMVQCGSFVADLLYRVVDPRTREQ